MAIVSMVITLGAVMTLGLVTSAYGCPSGGVAYSVGVGDPVCWSIPPLPNYYSNWSNSHFFKIGDILVYNFEGGLSNVVQVTKQEYESCTAYKPFKMFNNGPANFTLSEKGVLYFITNVSNYCTLGQKISISVHDCACPAVNQPPTPPHSLSPLPAALPPSSSVTPNTSTPSPSPSPSPSPLGHNGSSPVKSAAASTMLHTGIMLGSLSLAFVFWSSSQLRI